MNTVTIGNTSKGKRIWLQGVLERSGRTVGQRYDVAILQDSIHIVFAPQGKRKVTAAKGGIVDLCGAKYTKWAGSTASVTVEHTGAQIIIARV